MAVNRRSLEPPPMTNLSAPMTIRKEAGIETVARTYVGMVYAAAKRQTRSPEMAADVTQAVFVILRRKWSTLDNATVMSAWLMRVTRYASKDAQKLARRRSFHERKAAAMQNEAVGGEGAERAAAAGELSGLIDEAIDRLSGADRVAIMLTYFEGRTHEEVGRRLGVGTEAAHKRVQRAVERLRKLITGRKGREISTAALLMTLTAAAVDTTPAPAAMLGTVLSAVGGVPTHTGLAIAQETLHVMQICKIKTVAAGVAAASLLAGAGILAMPLAFAQAGAARPAPAAPATAVATSARVIGVQELTINQNGADDRFAADLETGQTSGVPRSLPNKFALFNWAARAGLDVAMDTEGGITLLGFDMAVVPAENSGFDAMDAERMVKNVGVLQAASLAPMPVRGELPVTYLFKTREGSIGVLQIVSSEPTVPGSITLRYKLLDAAVQERQSALAAEELLGFARVEQKALIGIKNPTEAAQASRLFGRTVGMLERLTQGKPGAAFAKARIIASALEDAGLSPEGRKGLMDELEAAWAGANAEVQKMLDAAGAP
jgi:RNA polymerase sigma factor (sigma-70 family)